MELGKITITGGNSTGECKYIQVFMMLICGNKQSMSISIDKKKFLSHDHLYFKYIGLYRIRVGGGYMANCN